MHYPTWEFQSDKMVYNYGFFEIFFTPENLLSRGHLYIKIQNLLSIQNFFLLKSRVAGVFVTFHMYLKLIDFFSFWLNGRFVVKIFLLNKNQVFHDYF
jgi:hypothetical protein